jgi:hypothetical protein
MSEQDPYGRNGVNPAVNSDGRCHATMIPAHGPNDAFARTQRVDLVRSLSA